MSPNSLPDQYGSLSFVMRHKYVTAALVLARTPFKESAALVTLLTEEFGLVRARAEGLRKSGAKLAHALQTFDRCEVTLVRGKEGWRLSGAILEESWFKRLKRLERMRAGRMAGLLLRLVHGEANDPSLFVLFTEFLEALPELSEEAQDTAEIMTALRVLAVLGLDVGVLPHVGIYEPLLSDQRRELVMRVNRGIAASGL
ncbi:MAG: repair protein RecO [Patescibacteria group bacterium]|nr:repair protein RecO [Patescibacteria group bacterium]